MADEGIVCRHAAIGQRNSIFDRRRQLSRRCKQQLAPRGRRSALCARDRAEGAEERLADRRVFTLSDTAWDEFRRGLLLDALGRTLHVADAVGVRALAVHANDDKAAAFCKHFGFVPSPTDDRHLHMIIKDGRNAAQRN